MRLLLISGAFTAAGSKAEFLTLDPHRNLENQIATCQSPFHGLRHCIALYTHERGIMTRLILELALWCIAAVVMEALI